MIIKYDPEHKAAEVMFLKSEPVIVWEDKGCIRITPMGVQDRPVIVEEELRVEYKSKER